MGAKWMPEAVAFAVALGCVLALAPLIRRLCARWGIFDQPGHLKIHGEPIPRLGGMAIAFALAAGVTSALHGTGAGALYFAAARCCFMRGAGGSRFFLPAHSRLSRSVCW